MMADKQHSAAGISQTGRALIGAMRSLAAASPACSRQGRDRAVEALAAASPHAIPSECLCDIAEAVEEIAKLGMAVPVFAPIEQQALAESERRLIATTSALYRGAICQALEELTRLCGGGRIGRVLFPLKALASKLRCAGIEVAPIGVRSFRVIRGGGRSETPRSARRGQLRVAN
jgi:hypothetical protein